MKNSYVTALTESILAGKSVEAALAALKQLMEKRGHLRLYSQVLKASARVLEAKMRSAAAQITIAAEGSVSEEKIQAALKALGAAATDYQKTIDPTLVGGFTARVKDTFFDASYKRVLIDLYRQVTN